MKVFQTVFWLILISAPVGLAFVAFQSVEDTALVGGAEKLTPNEIARAKTLLREHDPRQLKNAEQKTITLSAKELSLIASHSIQLFSKGGARVELKNNSLSTLASIHLPKLTPEYFINLNISLAQREGGIEVETMRVGKLQVPRVLANSVAKFAILQFYRYSEIDSANELIKAIEVSPNQLAITYEWQDKLLDAVRNQLLAPDMVERLERYNRGLVEHFADAPREMPLERVVEFLVKGSDAGQDAIKENQALIISLSNYVNGRRMSSLIPEVKSWPVPKRVKLKIHGRHDLAQHFATSASLAVAAGGELANAIGLFKELDDSDGGSGFSFKDLAADRCGTQFGKLAVLSEKSAKALRVQIRSGLGANDLVPSLVGLEEKMTEAQFKARYGGIDSRKYNQVVADIDARIDASKVYQ